MNVITIGSKIFDDAIIQMGVNIRNQERITDISPFAFSHNYIQQSSISKDSKEFDYKNKLITFELTGEEWKNNLEYDHVIIDMLDARLSFIEMVFENNVTMRVSLTSNQNDCVQRVYEYFNSKGIKLVEKKEINPLNMSDEQLDIEIKKFAEFLSAKYDVSKIVLIENYNVKQLINNNNDIELVPNYEKIEIYNNFYRKCDSIIKKYISIKTISVPANNIADTRKQQYHFFVMSRPYHKFLINQIINTNKDKENREAYENEIYDLINIGSISSFAERIANEKSKKKVVLIGDSSLLRYILKNKYCINIEESIGYYPWSNENEIELQIQEYIKSYQCLFVINRLYNSKNLLLVLKNMGLREDSDYICIGHKPVYYKNFSGKIIDVFNNQLSFVKSSDVCVAGWGNMITSYADSNVSIDVKNYNEIFLDKNVVCSNSPCLRIECETGCKVTIGKNTRIINGVEIRSGSFSKIDIGKECLFSTEITLKILMNKILNNIDKREIVIGNAVWVGYRSFIMSNTNIGDGAVVGARTTLWNKNIPNNCIVAGEEGMIIRKNIIWNKDPLLHEISECNNEYMRLTREEN